MKAAYRDVGSKLKAKKGENWCLDQIQVLETVPRRWPLARLTIPLLKCVEYLDRILAGCCWEVFLTRLVPDDSLSSLRSAAKSLTILVAGYLAEFVAEILREVLTHPSTSLIDEENKHLLSA